MVKNTRRSKLDKTSFIQLPCLESSKECSTYIECVFLDVIVNFSKFPRFTNGYTQDNKNTHYMKCAILIENKPLVSLKHDTLDVYNAILENILPVFSIQDYSTNHTAIDTIPCLSSHHLCTPPFLNIAMRHFSELEQHQILKKTILMILPINSTTIDQYLETNSVFFLRNDYFLKYAVLPLRDKSHSSNTRNVLIVPIFNTRCIQESCFHTVPFKIKYESPLSETQITPRRLHTKNQHYLHAYKNLQQMLCMLKQPNPLQCYLNKQLQHSFKNNVSKISETIEIDQVIVFTGKGIQMIPVATMLTTKKNHINDPEQHHISVSSIQSYSFKNKELLYPTSYVHKNPIINPFSWSIASTPINKTNSLCASIQNLPSQRLNYRQKKYPRRPWWLMMPYAKKRSEQKRVILESSPKNQFNPIRKTLYPSHFQAEGISDINCEHCVQLINRHPFLHLFKTKTFYPITDSAATLPCCHPIRMHPLYPNYKQLYPLTPCISDIKITETDSNKKVAKAFSEITCNRASGSLNRIEHNLTLLEQRQVSNYATRVKLAMRLVANFTHTHSDETSVSS